MSRAPALIVLAVALLAAGCGGGSSGNEAAPATSTAPGRHVLATSQTPTVLERQYGAGPDGFYLFTPRRRSWKQMVVFVHGHGDASEITPVNHRPWLRHLAERGSAVVYPRYEDQPGGHGAARHVDSAVRSALEVLDRKAPTVGIGYSRGGRLVLDWAAIAPRGLKPQAIVSVFPASSEDKSPDLSGVARDTRILVLSGDKDEVVGPYGATEMLFALQKSGFDLHHAKWHIVESTHDFTASHLAPLDDSPRAQKLFWAPADRMIAETLGGG